MLSSKKEATSSLKYSRMKTSYRLLEEWHEPRKLHFPPLYADTCFCFGGASKLNIADLVQGFEKPFCRFVEAVGDVVHNLEDIEPGRFQTVYWECQEPNMSPHIVIPSINLRALLVTVVAPSRRPVALRY